MFSLFYVERAFCMPLSSYENCHPAFHPWFNKISLPSISATRKKARLHATHLLYYEIRQPLSGYFGNSLLATPDNFFNSLLFCEQPACCHCYFVNSLPSTPDNFVNLELAHYLNIWCPISGRLIIIGKIPPPSPPPCCCCVSSHPLHRPLLCPGVLGFSPSSPAI